MILKNIPPGYTTNVQLYVRNADNTVGATVGGLINGTSSGSTYTYDLGSYASGDYFAQLKGVSSPNADAFPVRDNVAYPTFTWSIVDATVTATPTTPSPISGMCNLLVSTTGGAGSRVWAKLADTNNTADQILVGQQVVEDTTDSDGNATLVLIRYGQFTTGGTYRIRVADSSRVISNNVLVRMPNTASANLEDLTPL